MAKDNLTIWPIYMAVTVIILGCFCNSIRGDEYEDLINEIYEDSNKTIDMKDFLIKIRPKTVREQDPEYKQLEEMLSRNFPSEPDYATQQRHETEGQQTTRHEEKKGLSPKQWRFYKSLSYVVFTALVLLIGLIVGLIKKRRAANKPRYAAYPQMLPERNNSGYATYPKMLPTEKPEGTSEGTV